MDAEENAHRMEASTRLPPGGNLAAPTFESLIDRYQQEIMSYAVRSLRDSLAAQDAFQETFLRAFRAYPRLPETANRRAWLYRIASNVCHDARRQRARQPLPLDEALVYGDGPEEGTHELALAVRSFVESLPRRQREAVLLRKFQAMGYDEIALVLGCSMDAARANVYQGLRRIRAHFTEVTS
jgi:RNA polymerase sigma factor (sigma-70 family)